MLAVVGASLARRRSSDARSPPAIRSRAPLALTARESEPEVVAELRGLARAATGS